MRSKYFCVGSSPRERWSDILVLVSTIVFELNRFAVNAERYRKVVESRDGSLE
ncbi:MAG: hypothetical protein AB1489_29770 [Acidobacteriota bacterium]